MLCELKNLKTALDTIKHAMHTHFLSKKISVEILDPLKEDIIAPSILLDLDQIDDGEDQGDEKIPYECTLTAYCILDANTPKLSLAIKDFAAETMQVVRRNTWNLIGANIPENLSAQPASIKPGKRGYEAWAVTWKQTFRIGENVWDSTFPAPSIVMFSDSPDIGIPHEADYVEIGDIND